MPEFFQFVDARLLSQDGFALIPPCYVRMSIEEKREKKNNSQDKRKNKRRRKDEEEKNKNKQQDENAFEQEAR